MTVTNKVTAVYVGENTICAINAYRSVFGVGVEGATKAVGNKHGVVMTAPVLRALREEYSIRTPGSVHIFDWEVNGSTKPTDPMGIADK